MTSWDDYLEALGAKPAWAQYADQKIVENMVKTAEQLAAYGVSYPHRYEGIRSKDQWRLK